MTENKKYEAKCKEEIYLCYDEPCEEMKEIMLNTSQKLDKKQELLEYLLSFLDKKGRLNPTNSGYFK
jgi:hypothetical protein